MARLDPGGLVVPARGGEASTEDRTKRKGNDMADKEPNIVVFWWDNFGWGELGCYGGGVLRGAATPRIDSIADQGLKLLNFNVEA
jgi:hypothetical protein